MCFIGKKYYLDGWRIGNIKYINHQINEKMHYITYHMNKNGIQKMGRHTVIQSTLKCVPCGKEGCNDSQISDCLNSLDINWIINEIKNHFIS